MSCSIKFLFCTFFCYCGVMSIPTSFYSKVDLIKANSDLYEEEIVDLVKNITITALDVNNMRNKMSANISRARVKRQNSGAGRYAEASKMPQIKLLRLFLQMFKNFWDSAYIGGAHPLHPNVPKTILALYKEKVVEFFVPDVGENPNKMGK